MTIANTTPISVHDPIIATPNAQDCSVVKHIELIPAAPQTETTALFAGTAEIYPALSCLLAVTESFSHYAIELSNVHGQEMTKHSLIIAAAGNHYLLMISPPGSGETENKPKCPSHTPTRIRCIDER